MIVTLVGTAVALGACTAVTPTLRVNVANGAAEVPLDTTLEITAVNAKLERALLERVDAPSTPVELVRTERGARLDSKLAPDAEYRLVASAEPEKATPLPWASADPKLIVEHVFSTAHTPLLLDDDTPLVATRGKQITVHFSEPLAQARAEGPRSSAEARIAADDAHKLLLDLKDLRPGEELEIRFVDIVGKNGVEAPEQTVLVQTPDPARLVTVNGAEGERISLAPDATVLLEWGEPVTSVRYRTGNGPSATWTGTATTDVELPIKLAQGESETLAIEDATTVSGGWMSAPRTLDLVGAAPLQLAAYWPANGATNLLPNADPTFRFSEPITDRAAAEAAISFDPTVPGRFEWLAPNRVRFLPESSFPRETEIAVSVKGGQQGVHGASGGFMTESQSFVFTTGKDRRIDVSLGRQVLTLYENDTPVWTAPVATGVRGAETPLGTYKVEYKMRQARFRGVNPGGSRYDIPDVNWVIAFLGDYTIHGAYWRTTFGRPGSNGCISLTDANARYVWLWADEGTPIVIRG